MLRNSLMMAVMLLSWTSVNSCGEKTSFKSKQPAKSTATETEDVKVNETEKPEPTVTSAPQKTEAVPNTVEIPKNAVTKGSYTVFTIPADPIPRKPYDIVVLVTLPSDTNNYFAEDLSGTIHGTDTYFQDIRKDFIENGSFATEEEYYRVVTGELPIEDGKATYRVTVPGANFMVKDVIKVRSELLGEEQIIEIIF